MIVKYLGLHIKLGHDYKISSIAHQSRSSIIKCQSIAHQSGSIGVSIKRQKPWSPSSVSGVVRRKIVRRQSWDPSAI